MMRQYWETVDDTSGHLSVNRIIVFINLININKTLTCSTILLLFYLVFNSVMFFSGLLYSNLMDHSFPFDRSIDR